MQQVFINANERDRLFELTSEGHTEAVALYVLHIRFLMDAATGVAGVVRRLCHFEMCEILKVGGRRGKSGKQYSKAKIIRYVNFLINAGLLKRVAGKDGIGAPLVFELPLGTKGKNFVRPEEVRSISNAEVCNAPNLDENSPSNPHGSGVSGVPNLAKNSRGLEQEKFGGLHSYQLSNIQQQHHHQAGGIQKIASTKMEITLDWEPSNTFDLLCQNMAVRLSEFDEATRMEILGEFRAYWSTTSNPNKFRTPSEWDKTLANQFKRHQQKCLAAGRLISEHAVPVSLSTRELTPAQEMADRSWSEP